MPDAKPEPRRTGRPPIGPVVKAAMWQPVVDLLDAITDRMGEFTTQLRSHTQAGHRLIPSNNGKTWSRADVVAAIVQAGAPQFAHYILADHGAVKLGMPCPLCHGFVDGPHAGNCGYFGPLAEHDPHFDDRLRHMLSRTGGRCQFAYVDGTVHEIWKNYGTAPKI